MKGFLSLKTIRTFAISLSLLAISASLASSAPAAKPVQKAPAATAAVAIPAPPATAAALVPVESPATARQPTAAEIIYRAGKKLEDIPAYSVKFGLFQNKTHRRIPEDLLDTYWNRYKLAVRCDHPGNDDCAIRLEALAGIHQDTQVYYNPRNKKRKVVIVRPKSVYRVNTEDPRVNDVFRTPIQSVLTSLDEEIRRKKGEEQPPGFMQQLFGLFVKAEPPKKFIVKTKVATEKSGDFVVTITAPERRTTAVFTPEYDLVQYKLETFEKRGSTKTNVDLEMTWSEFKTLKNAPDAMFEPGRK